MLNDKSHNFNEIFKYTPDEIAFNLFKNDC